MKPKKPSRPGAFTLVEMMIAVAIFSIIVGAIYSTWLLIAKSSRVAQETTAQLQRQRIAVQTLDDSLSCIQSFQASLQYYYFVVQNGDHPLLSFTARVPGGFARNSRFGEFNLRRLTYTVETGSDGKTDLVLRQNPILMNLDADEQGTPLILASSVKQFTVECLDTNVGWVTEWLDTNSIPALVRYSLVLGGDGATPTLGVTNVVKMQSTMMPSVVQIGRMKNQ
jgi:prepilin-type N-terminal cleavage/methylation domain-containing protein